MFVFNVFKHAGIFGDLADEIQAGEFDPYVCGTAAYYSHLAPYCAVPLLLLIVLLTLRLVCYLSSRRDAYYIKIYNETYQYPNEACVAQGPGYCQIMGDWTFELTGW